MSVIPLTVFFSLLLAGLFIALFVHEQRRRRFASAERDSLLPLADETPHEVESAHEDHDHDHDHAAGGCGCRDGSRPPCVGCLRRTAAPADSAR
jgi:ABC-type nickel/cobalt efflux system permease component RcnA